MRINEKYLRIHTYPTYELRASLFRFTIMNTDMNQLIIDIEVKIYIGMLIIYGK